MGTLVPEALTRREPERQQKENSESPNRQITFADTRSACDVIGLAQIKSRYTSPWGVRVRTRVGTIAAVHHDDDCPIRGQLVNSGLVAKLAVSAFVSERLCWI